MARIKYYDSASASWKYADANIGNSGSNIELDTTLTVAGKAADAKAVGDAIGKLSSQNPNQGVGLTSTEKNAVLTILDGVIVETSKQSVIAQALATLKQLWSGGEVYISQNGTTLTLENVAAVTTITQNGTVLALA